MKAANTVAVLADIAALGLVENVADVLGRVTQMLELGNKMSDRLLKEDIVFPERIVRINQ